LRGQNSLRNLFNVATSIEVHFSEVGFGRGSERWR
jgi:hypothetical protein